MAIKILAIEDEKTVQNIYKRMLNDNNYELLLASTGLDGMQEIKDNPDIGLVILDAGLPDVDGFGILEEIQQLKPDLPIIMISGFDLAEQIYNLTQPSSVHFLKKPFTPEEIYEAIHNSLNEEKK